LPPKHQTRRRAFRGEKKKTNLGRKAKRGGGGKILLCVLSHLRLVTPTLKRLARGGKGDKSCKQGKEGLVIFEREKGDR